MCGSTLKHVRDIIRTYNFDIVFAELRVILRTGYKFVEIVAVAERYLIIIHVKNKEEAVLNTLSRTKF